MAGLAYPTEVYGGVYSLSTKDGVGPNLVFSSVFSLNEYLIYPNEMLHKLYRLTERTIAPRIKQPELTLLGEVIDK
jgi:hypothetical protein